MNKLLDESKIANADHTKVATMHYNPHTDHPTVAQLEDILAIRVEQDHQMFMQFLLATDALKEDWQKKHESNVTWFRVSLPAAVFKGQKTDAFIMVKKYPKLKVYVSLPILANTNRRWTDFEDTLTDATSVNRYLSDVLKATLESYVRRSVIEHLRDPNYEHTTIQDMLNEAAAVIRGKVFTEGATIEPEKEEDDEH